MTTLFQKTTSTKKLLLGVVAIFLLLAIPLWISLSFMYPTTSPINAILFFIESKQHPHLTMSSQTIAFLPYWRIDDTKYTRFDLLSEVNYFALNIDGSGNFIQITNNQTDPGWKAWNSSPVKDLIAKTQLSGDLFTLTIATTRNKVIESLLGNTQAQQTLITNILDQVASRRLNGITIDFEYDGKPDTIYIQAFTQFAKTLSSKLHEQSPHTTISLTLLPLAGREKGLFDLPNLTSYFDHFIGMSYDYYAATSDIAGPIAPMKGFAENKFFFDVTTTYQDFLKIIPKEKIIMGVPYYGWDWAVQKGKKIQSNTLPQSDPNSYTAVLSYARMREDKDLHPDQCTWDEFAQERWCWYITSNGVNHQAWFEDNKSIDIKYLYAKNMNFAGIAIWTLGYDKGYPDLWDLMRTDFAKSP